MFLPTYLATGFSSQEERVKFIKKRWYYRNHKKMLLLGAHYRFQKLHKETLLKRSKGRCEKCGEKLGLEVHHLDKNRENNTMRNLLLVCRSCHTKIHWKRKRLSFIQEIVKKLNSLSYA